MLYHKRDFLPPLLSMCSLLWEKAADTMEVAQRLRVGTSHAEDLGLVSSTHVGWLPTACDSSSLLVYCGMTLSCTRPVHTQIYTRCKPASSS